MVSFVRIMMSFGDVCKWLYCLFIFFGFCTRCLCILSYGLYVWAFWAVEIWEPLNTLFGARRCVVKMLLFCMWLLSFTGSSIHLTPQLFLFPTCYWGLEHRLICCYLYEYCYGLLKCLGVFLFLLSFFYYRGILAASERVDWDHVSTSRIFSVWT